MTQSPSWPAQMGGAPTNVHGENDVGTTGALVHVGAACDSSYVATLEPAQCFAGAGYLHLQQTLYNWREATIKSLMGFRKLVNQWCVCVHVCVCVCVCVYVCVCVCVCVTFH